MKLQSQTEVLKDKDPKASSSVMSILWLDKDELSRITLR